MFDLVGLTHVLGLSTIIQDLLRFHPRKCQFSFEAPGETNLLDHQNLDNDLEHDLKRLEKPNQNLENAVQNYDVQQFPQLLLFHF